MKMYNNGLQDNELQLLHKQVKLNKNLFLNDMLDSSLFKVVEKDEVYHIYPLFNCDLIWTDGDAFINNTYLIVCPKDYQQILLFISETPISTEKTYTITNPSTNYYIIFIYDEWTLQPYRETNFSIRYSNNTVKQLTTDNLGYCAFETSNSNFEVIL